MVGRCVFLKKSVLPSVMVRYSSANVIMKSRPTFLALLCSTAVRTVALPPRSYYPHPERTHACCHGQVSASGTAFGVTLRPVLCNNLLGLFLSPHHLPGISSFRFSEYYYVQGIFLATKCKTRENIRQSFTVIARSQCIRHCAKLL